MNQDTTLFDIKKIKSADVANTLEEVIKALEESGYNPISQLVGYLISGDPGYITSRFEARNKITRFDRSELIGEILEGYLNS